MQKYCSKCIEESIRLEEENTYSKGPKRWCVVDPTQLIFHVSA